MANLRRRDFARASRYRQAADATGTGPDTPRLEQDKTVNKSALCR